jgi:sugar PTS system EIIA component
LLKNLFGKRNKRTEEVVVAPLNGKVIELEHVPDPTFSQKMMGDGLAIEPVEGKVVSPVKGEVVSIFPTKHAIGIKTEIGVEVLIHIGIDTVNMNGEGFNGHVKVGDKVNPGDPLMTFDLELVREKATSTITPVIITNGEIVEALEKHYEANAVKGETRIMTVKVKS